MKGRLFQILDIDGDPEGLYYTEDEIVSNKTIEAWYESFRESELYEKEGPDAFEIYVYQNFDRSNPIERVFVENIIPEGYE